MSEEFAIVDSEEVSTEPFPNSGVEHAKLTEALRAEDMRVNVLFLKPGDRVGYHTHERQEEIYVCTRGPGEVYIDGGLYEVPEGGTDVPADGNGAIGDGDAGDSDDQRHCVERRLPTGSCIDYASSTDSSIDSFSTDCTSGPPRWRAYFASSSLSTFSTGK